MFKFFCECFVWSEISGLSCNLLSVVLQSEVGECLVRCVATRDAEQTNSFATGGQCKHTPLLSVCRPCAPCNLLASVSHVLLTYSFACLNHNGPKFTEFVVNCLEIFA